MNATDVLTWLRLARADALDSGNGRRTIHLHRAYIEVGRPDTLRSDEHQAELSEVERPTHGQPS